MQAAEGFDLPGPIDRWRAARDEVHAQVCNEGFDPELGSFTQAYGSKKLDAALLQIPATGFLPATDERMVGTVAAIEKDLLQDGFVLRYRSESGDDGLPPGEGAFLPCSFWLVGNYVMQGRQQEARALYDKLIGDRQRRRPLLRGVRPCREASARQRAPGLHAPRVRACGGHDVGRRARQPPDAPRGR